MFSYRISKRGEQFPSSPFYKRCSCNPRMMRQFRKLLGWKQKKPRKNVVPDAKDRRSVSLGSMRKASTISMAISSLGFSVQLSQSESQLPDARCLGDHHDQGTENDNQGAFKMATSSSGTPGHGTSHAKKRSTTSSPPDETAAGIPPRLPEASDTDFRIQRSLTIDVMPRVDEGREDVESVFMRDYDDEMETLQAQLREEMPLKSSKSVIMEDVHFDQDDEEDLRLTNSAVSVETTVPVETRTQTNSQAPPTEWQPTATLLSLPPELVLEVSKYLPFCSHTALYDTCSRLNHVIRDNNSAYYERELAKAGANPRGDSLLTRSIFAFQYLNRPSHSPECHPEFSIDSSFGYIRYLKAQSQIVKDIADILQSDVYKTFLLSEEGRKQLRLTAHGNHEPEDLSHRDDVDRDLMHLWEFVNYSLDKLIRSEVPMYYPYGEQKAYYDATMPFALLSAADDATAEQLKKSISKLAKDTQFPHDQFLVWERKRLRDLRNEYWKEDTDNLSKVESKDMRWILEVVKAIFVGVVFKPFIEGPREKNKAILELKAKALRKASRTATPASPGDSQTPEGEEKRSDWLLSNQDWPGASSTDALSPGDVMSEEWQTPPYSLTYTEQEVRAYVAYLVATGGMKLLLTVLKAAVANGGALTPERLEAVLAQWDISRGNGEVDNIEFMKGFDAEKARERETERNPEKSEFAHLWKPTKVERIWERDCKRGGWSNWEGWVAEYYLIA
ncbi:hypothetical protein TWF481_007665 [Arthrobotrys musiformis]|uniref:F-box domain-containing protein n=1 Tax=Arthrobotrys musiformis TaxID=47236 RepID=A0AAV9WDP6_9PEZI